MAAAPSTPFGLLALPLGVWGAESVGAAGEGLARWREVRAMRAR